jgi:septal ring factor EnvC (AmiA/AmiB activator)
MKWTTISTMSVILLAATSMAFSAEVAPSGAPSTATDAPAIRRTSLEEAKASLASAESALASAKASAISSARSSIEYAQAKKDADALDKKIQSSKENSVAVSAEDATRRLKLSEQISLADKMAIGASEECRLAQKEVDRIRGVVKQLTPTPKPSIAVPPVGDSVSPAVEPDAPPRTDAASTDTGGNGLVHVRGYYRKNGTYVQPYTRRSPRK